MTKKEFNDLLKKKILVLDGATGTELQKRGLPGGVCPEKWVLENPSVIQEVQKSYFDNGSDVVYSCTFGCNRLKLEEFGLEKDVYSMNKSLAEISKAIASKNQYVAGDIAPTGLFVEPFGELPFEECVAVYKEQAQGLLDGGVDFFVIETMIDIQEMRAAVIAIKEICDLPIIASMTFGEDGFTLTGTDAVTALITLQSLGVSAFGCNCSTGPDKMLEIIKKIKPYATIPLVAKPNAGLPKLKNGKTVFDMTPEEYGTFVPAFVEAGVNLMGGCCGTSPLYIAEIAKCTTKSKPVWTLRNKLPSLSSARGHLFLDLGTPVKVIGERINPTGKKKLQESLKEGKLDEVKRFAAEQESSGASLLDVNMGMPGINEKDMMIASIKMLSSSSKLPLVIDSSDPEIIKAALRIYPGRALINSISLEKVKEPLIEVAAEFGAMFILLPLTDDEIPSTSEGRIANVTTLLSYASKFGLTKDDVIIDGIVMTVSSDQNAALETLQFIKWCAKDLQANTTLGLSNVSFGLPERKWVNGAFFAMCIYNGLTTAIANPNDEILMNLKYASDVLTVNDKGSVNYISNVVKTDATDTVKKSIAQKSPFDCVVSGDRDIIVDKIKQLMASGVEAATIINEQLIPGINKVGELYEKKVYFLPQLISGAEAMKAAFSYLEAFITKDSSSPQKLKVILATVKGDIHDIGKNIVGIMLKNYGFDVIDLGKDVDSGFIIDEAIRHNVAVIGLSALMTTTMIHMKDVVKIAKEKGVKAKIIIGGAVTTQEYADEIGADGFSRDGLDAVKLAKKLCGVE
ncbi:MAG: 5-methyltetrahydrofolate--homocysteine methyltransferase [Spirochaetes bacterium GWF1_31_7]|nr:MAG: 5-methyltetrahydrofolate--homocysteine methyltransferase [Spirochaetes bacterium GWE1_32_154]OHD51220.1 MAG: 5-methyltetrahydrofolate--homocysteine methyltransferase [Spirochaetes bacterium GWF1_31_7]HBD92538.1 5-methyltetrahydrofolate--homocysteine methyltransferase [Spirochaetia bacterium]HBI37424.1 5-methyltetrahydrofolate--homocysteine methyltransferase [Spirochaetia bacterium]